MNGSLHHSLDFYFAGYICPGKKGFVPLSLDSRDRFFAALFIDVRSDDLSAFTGKCERTRAANAARRAGDDCNSSTKLHAADSTVW